MEYTSKHDFFLRFKAIFNEKDQFIDYILIEVSENFQNLSKIKLELLIGKKIYELFADSECDFLGAKEFYYNMIPNTSRKFEKYIEEFNSWYLINIYSDEKGYLILIYTEMSSLFESCESSFKNLLCG